jgi:hypothetical protein
MGVPPLGNGGHTLSCDSESRSTGTREVGVLSPYAYQLVLRSWAHLGLCSSVFFVCHIEITLITAIHGITFFQYARLRDIRNL